MKKGGKTRKKLSIVIAGDDGKLYKVGEDVITKHPMKKKDPLYETSKKLIDAGATHAVLESHEEIEEGGSYMINGVHLLNLKAFVKRHKK